MTAVARKHQGCPASTSPHPTSARNPSSNCTISESLFMLANISALTPLCCHLSQQNSQTADLHTPQNQVASAVRYFCERAHPGMVEASVLFLRPTSMPSFLSCPKHWHWPFLDKTYLANRNKEPETTKPATRISSSTARISSSTARIFSSTGRTVKDRTGTRLLMKKRRNF